MKREAGNELVESIREAGEAFITDVEEDQDASSRMEASWRAQEAAHRIIEMRNKMQKHDIERESASSTGEESTAYEPEAASDPRDTTRPETSTATINQTSNREREKISNAAQRAADTGHLDLRDLDVEVAAADIEASTQDFHYAATVLESVRMPYPMMHIAGIGWAPLDLSQSIPASA